MESHSLLKMFRFILLGLILYCAESQASAALKRQSMIYYEPPFENIKSADSVTEHYITQPVDHFNHQDNRTFSMVSRFSIGIFTEDTWGLPMKPFHWNLPEVTFH